VWESVELKSIAKHKLPGRHHEWLHHASTLLSWLNTSADGGAGERGDVTQPYLLADAYQHNPLPFTRKVHTTEPDAHHYQCDALTWAIMAAWHGPLQSSTVNADTWSIMVQP